MEDSVGDGPDEGSLGEPYAGPPVAGGYRRAPRRRVTVGEALQRGLEDAGVAQISLANKTGISTKHINRLIKDHCRLSVEMAVRIEMAVPSISAEGLLIDQLRQEIADYVEGHHGRGRNAAVDAAGPQRTAAGGGQDLQQGDHRGAEPDSSSAR